MKFKKILTIGISETSLNADYWKKLDNLAEKRLAKDDIVCIMDHTDELTPEQAKKLSKHKNCIMYPPIGYTTKEATANKQDIFVKNIKGFLEGSPINKIN